MNELVLEKDYVLTWIILGIADSDLYPLLAFKGGTALRKIYFPDYRFSEDLDFTVLEKVESDDLISGLGRVIADLSKGQGFQFALPSEKIERRNDSITAYISFVGPLQAKLGSRDIKVDFTLSEKLIFPVEPHTIYRDYSDAVEKQILTYSLEEIMVEKLCAIIGRTEPRDVYDLDYLFDQNLDFMAIPNALVEKAEFKGIDPNRLLEVLEKKKPTLERMWKTRLAHQVKDLPHLEEVLRNLQRNIKKHVELGD
ncbi:nucleotidyl transferase AbiEii/AbiGii toxin family protein [Candidatus Aquicultor secundus]|nr:nucleotidyl transferase AbiEii/AbiGii toxin family protein [Candidatus Aquicultor secundus]NCO66814.1 nucleotidyl transferase AbiEii/AbiGii toxin family protein [Solirubrobacter sp.]